MPPAIRTHPLSFLTSTRVMGSFLNPPRLRFCLRMTVGAVLAFALAQFFGIPLHGLWAVLTAVVVTQMSVGESLKATADYVIGTIGGALYAGAVAAFVPHSTTAAAAGVLALAIAPLAYAAAVNPSFRVAPFTAVIVLMISSQLAEPPVESAFYRLVEVSIGGGVALLVSLLVFPSRAHLLGLDVAARALVLLARALPRLLASTSSAIEAMDNRPLQDEIGAAVDKFEAIAAEAKREQMINLVVEPDPSVLARSLLRLRHDIVIIGRAGSVPLPRIIAERVGPQLAQVGAAASDFLRASAIALTSRRCPPPFDPVEATLAVYASEIAAIRGAGLMQALSDSELERVFALGFALQELQQHFLDLARCVREWARLRV